MDQNGKYVTIATGTKSITKIEIKEKKLGSDTNTKSLKYKTNFINYNKDLTKISLIGEDM